MTAAVARFMEDAPVSGVYSAAGAEIVAPLTCGDGGVAMLHETTDL